MFSYVIRRTEAKTIYKHKKMFLSWSEILIIFLYRKMQNIIYIRKLFKDEFRKKNRYRKGRLKHDDEKKYE